MATGMSKAKARRNSKTKTMSPRSKLGLPAKAGRRRPHNIVKNVHGDYVAAEFTPRPKVEKVEAKSYIMGESRDTTIIPSGAVLHDGLARINKMERHAKNNSDPFAFDRMRAHFKLGIFEFGKEHK